MKSLFLIPYVSADKLTFEGKIFIIKTRVNSSTRCKMSTYKFIFTSNIRITVTATELSLM